MNVANINNPIIGCRLLESSGKFILRLCFLSRSLGFFPLILPRLQIVPLVHSVPAVNICQHLPSLPLLSAPWTGVGYRLTTYSSPIRQQDSPTYSLYLFFLFPHTSLSFPLSSFLLRAPHSGGDTFRDRKETRMWQDVQPIEQRVGQYETGHRANKKGSWTTWDRAFGHWYVRWHLVRRVSSRYDSYGTQGIQPMSWCAALACTEVGYSWIWLKADRCFLLDYIPERPCVFQPITADSKTNSHSYSLSLSLSLSVAHSILWSLGDICLSRCNEW